MSTVKKNPDNIVTVDASKHRTLRVKPNPGFAHAREQHVVSVLLSELAVCASNFPIVFIPRPGDGKYLLMALLGLRSGENIFYGPDYWECTYVPLAIQRHPFVIGYDDRVADAEQVTTCLEIDSPLLSEQEGSALFNEAGEQSALLSNAHQMLNAMFESQKLTDQFAQALTGLGLIVPFDLLLQQQNGEVRKAAGLFTLDEMKLKKLGSEQLKELHDRDFLPACYLMLASLHQFKQLIRLRNRKGKDQVVNFQIEFNTA